MRRVIIMKKRCISLILALSMTVTGCLATADYAGAAVPKKDTKQTVIKRGDTEAESDFALQSFASLYKDKLLTCQEQDVKLDTKTEEGSLLVSGDNGVIAKTTFQIEKTFDFDKETIDRIQINALAKRATKTYLNLYLDNETQAFASIRLYNQAKEDDWSRKKIYSYDLDKNTQKLTGKHTIRFQIDDRTTKSDKKAKVLLRSIQFVQAALPVVSLDIDEEYGSIAEMNGSSNHSKECYGQMSISVPDNYVCEFGTDATTKATEATYDLDYIRGRGNSTWDAPKKPYKIKLDKKADLFGMGANKHWVLLANYYDNSLLRNRITYYLGRKLGMEYTPECVSVDVVMNHEYLGSYLLCEQVRLDENRVDEVDLESETCMGEDLSGGYLLSMGGYYTENNDLVINTTQNNSFLIESPAEGKFTTEAAKYIKQYVQSTENAIYSSDFNNADGKSYRDLMDVPSAIAYYWMQEFSMNGDSFISNSTYLYKKQKGKLYWGPLWDFDYVAWASYDYSQDESSYTGFNYQRTWFNRLVEDPSFAKELKAYWPTLKAALEDLVKDGGMLDQYATEVSSSAENNFSNLGFTDFYGGWDEEDNSAQKQALTYPEEIERLRTWIKNRMQWVDTNLDMIAPEEITLTYQVDGETYATQQASTNRAIQISVDPPTPKEGYAFDGWYYTNTYINEETGEEESYEVKFTSGDILSKDTILTAKWIEKKNIVEAEDVIFERPEIYISEGRSLSLSYAVVPMNATNSEVNIISSDTSVVTYDSLEGEWIAHGIGTATLTATTGNGKKDTCIVHVLSWDDLMENYDDYLMKDFSLSDTNITLKEGEWKKVDALTVPDNAMNIRISWRSLEEDIAMVQGGIIYGAKAGDTIVLVYDSYTEIFHYCKVTVTSASKPDTPVDTTKPGTTFTKSGLIYQITKKTATQKEVAVTGVDKKNKKTSLSVPSKVSYQNQTWKVTKIASSAFKNQKKLKAVTLGSNIQSVGTDAFKNCKKLKKITISSAKLKSIGKNAFQGIYKKAVFYVTADKLKSYKKLLKKKAVKNQICKMK